MRFSANLNIIIKAIEKASIHISRDFVELENLQSNPASCGKFAISSYNRVKQILIEDFAKFRHDFNIIFSDSSEIINQKDAEYTLLVHAIDGIENFHRSSPDFTVSIALIHKNSQGQSETISLAISKVIGGELYYSEKGYGAFVNNRRIRVSKRPKNQKSQIITAGDNLKLLQEYYQEQEGNVMFRNFGCKTLDIAYFASARIDQIIYQKAGNDLFHPFFLLAKEAGGRVMIEDQKFILNNF